MAKNLAVAMLAHVDAGKTTLTEAMLFRGGFLKRLGRVDHKDAFLDTDEMERRRGITIFSKQAVLPLEGMNLTLLDTPGHVDFSTEMERTLQVLDYAILVISGSEGVQGHTTTLWQLLARYRIPTFLFVNKMDLAGTDPAALLVELKERLDGGCVSFSGREGDPEAFQEEVALCGEEALSHFLERGRVEDPIIAALISERKLFPCFFGSALKLEGVDGFLQGLSRYAGPPSYPVEFGARVYKISRDAQNNRLTHLKITGGSLAVRTPLTNRREELPEEEIWSEKVNQIRIYSGEKYRAVEEAEAGAVCAVTGLSRTYPGQGLGTEAAAPPPVLEPVLSYRVNLPPGCEPHGALRKLRELEEEDPLLAISWSEQAQEIHLHLMGEVQMEVLQHVVRERLGLDVSFDAGTNLYRETISGPVVGMGHFEPLRHYAEVHLLLEPGERGSGLVVDSACSEDVLHRSWQRLILTHLEEREHPGVLTGAPVTDLKITLLTGKAHEEHTEGGDFRQATYRAVRQGLMQAKNVLLEPWYRFRLEVPVHAVGRAMTDLQLMSADLSLPESSGEFTVLSGTAPVSALREYAGQVAAYTRGLGRLTCSFSGFAPCHNQEEAVAASGYDPGRDTDNPADSVFCSHGAGFIVKWNEVQDYMHLESGIQPARESSGSQKEDTRPSPGRTVGARPSFEQDGELRAIFEQAYGPLKRREDLYRPPSPPRETAAAPSSPRQWEERKEEGEPDYLLVDGYNIIHGWEDLAAVARQSMDSARQILMDLLSNYAGYRKREVILVFDAYKVPGGTRSVSRYHGIHIVYTQEAETADAYIEKVTYEMGKKRRVSVATSDGTVQLIIMGHGALRITPQALRGEIEQANADISAIIRAVNRPRFSPSITLPEE